MNVSSIQSSEQRKKFFIKYANAFMSNSNENNEEIQNVSQTKMINNKKIDKTMGIETLTIFPKQVINGKTIITA